MLADFAPVEKHSRKNAIISACISPRQQRWRDPHEGAKIIEPQKPEPIQPERFRSRRHNRIVSNNIQAMDDFEREYQEFIAKLKAKKEQKEEITTEPITEEPKPVEVTEPEVIEVAEPVIIEEVPVKKKRQRRKKLKEEQIENMEN